jgi:hypothetical protein
MLCFDPIGQRTVCVHTVPNSVAESHYFYVAPCPGKNFDAATALSPTLLQTKIT